MIDIDYVEQLKSMCLHLIRVIVHFSFFLFASLDLCHYVISVIRYAIVSLTIILLSSLLSDGEYNAIVCREAMVSWASSRFGRTCFMNSIFSSRRETTIWLVVILNDDSILLSDGHYTMGRIDGTKHYGQTQIYIYNDRNDPSHYYWWHKYIYRFPIRLSPFFFYPFHRHQISKPILFGIHCVSLYRSI